MTSDLLNAFLSADPAAEKKLFDGFYKPLCFYGEKMVHNLAQAEDMATEAIIKLMNKRSDFSSLPAIRSYLFRLVHNAALNYIAAQKTHTHIESQIAYLAEKNEGINDATENEMLRAEILFEIYQEINSLPGRCGEIFKMLFVDEISTQEVADHFSINVQTVRSQKSRAIQLLKASLFEKNKIQALNLLSVWSLM